MVKFLKISLTVLIVVLVVATACFAGYWFYFIKHWPWWIAVSMAAGVFGLYFLLLFLRKYFVRRREKRFVQRIVDQGEVVGENERPETQAILELERSWKYYLDVLKNSHLKKRGNPLYVLPWYLAMGETGVGKTTMLANVGATTSFTELEDRQGQIGATRNCDWVFFDDAVVLDTAGRYSVPLSSNQEKNEWKRFLLLIAKSRRREPINGIILFVAADDLLQNDYHSLRKKAQVIRNRIHSLMRMIGYKIPVSVVVTKMDSVPGFTEFVSLLTEEERGQAMGQLNSPNTPRWQDLLEKTFLHLFKALHTIRLAKISLPQGRKASFFALPMQLQPLQEGLESFLGAIFSENSYQETPVIQGIFVGSGICTLSPAADFLPKGFTDDFGSKGLPFSAFAKDLFVKVLPGNRWPLEPVKELLLWKRITSRLAVVAWLCLIIFVGGCIGLSYLHNKKVLTSFLHKKETISLQERDSNAALVSLEKMRLDIINIEKMNGEWRFPFKFYTAADTAVAAYKKLYIDLFESSVLTPMEEGFEETVDSIADRASGELYAEYVAYVVEQINYLKRYITGEIPPEFNSFSNVASAVLAIKRPDLLSQVGKYFPDLNASYLAWNLDKSDNEERLVRLQDTLDKLLKNNRGEVTWLFADVIADSPSIALADFWKNRQVTVTKKIKVPGAFTKKGRDKIAAFLKEIQFAGVDEAVFEDLNLGYKKSYLLQFIRSWKVFGANFAEGELELNSDFEWRDAAILMTSARNPYFSLLQKMSEEFVALASDSGTDLPDWGTSLVAMDKIRKLSESESSKSDKNSTRSAQSSLMSKVSSEETKIAAEVLLQIDPSKAAAMDEQLRLADAWGQYEDGLAGLKGMTPFQEKAAAEFMAWFRQANDSGKEQALFTSAYSAWVTLETLGSRQYPSNFVWKLINGPFSFLQDFAAYNTAKVLEQKWQEEVLASVVSVDPQKIDTFLFDKDKGVVWKYLEKYAHPFITQSETGYKARRLYDRALNFTPEFYSFINRASSVVVNVQSVYAVTLQTIPIEVNSDAKVEPYYATMTMNCAKDSYRLENDNFPRKLSINWSPDSCSDVTLTIGLPNMEISTSWLGNLAFAHFLKQFQYGKYRFTAKDFPEQQGYLAEQNIKFIGISYTMSGIGEVVQLVNTAPGKIPEHIIFPGNQLSTKKRQSEEEVTVLPQRLAVAAAEPEPARGKVKNTPTVTSNRYHGTAWFLEQEPERYTVQLMSLSREAAIARGFALLRDNEEKAVYSREVAGAKWFILCSGVFSNPVEAGEYIDSLPPSVKKSDPVIRTFAGIRKEIKSDQNKE